MIMSVTKAALFHFLNNLGIVECNKFCLNSFYCLDHWYILLTQQSIMIIGTVIIAFYCVHHKFKFSDSKHLHKSR